MRVGDFDFKVKRIKDIPLLAEDEVGLTAEGREAAEKGQFSDNRGRILDDLNSSGMTSIEELSSDTRIPIHKVKQAVSDLIKRGLTRKAGIEPEGSYRGFNPRDFSRPVPGGLNEQSS